MAEPLLHRLPSNGRYDKRYRVHGFDHLVVEAYFDSPDDRRPEQFGWLILDNRFTVLDKYRRLHVIHFDILAEVRSWIKAGGAALWDPEKRKTDRNWKPIPDGWTPGEARSQVPRRADSRIRDAGGMGGRPERGRDVRPGGGGPDLGRNPEPGQPTDRILGGAELKGKRFAVCPGFVRSVNDGQLHWIGFGALTWLYGVNPNECVLMDEKALRGREPKAYEHLIYLHPQREYEGYESMREELARGDDAFKLVEP